MPPTTTIPQLRSALKSRSTKTTRAFNKLLGTGPGNRRSQVRGKIANPGDLNRAKAAVWGLPNGWARDELKTHGGQGLMDAEVDHARDWPDEQKEQVRFALHNAITNGRKVKFFWDLHHGTTEVTTIEDPGAPGAITITFLSPWSGVRALGAQSNIHVNVGPKDPH